MRFAPLIASAAAYNAVVEQNIESMSLTAVEEFVGGAVYELIEKDDLPEIKKCLANTEVVTAEVKEILEEASKGDFQDVVKAVQGMIKLVQELPADLQDCQNIQGDVTKITNWVESFITPAGLENVVKNVMSHWSEIQADVGKINTDIAQSQFKEAGEMSADIVIAVLGKIDLSEVNYKKIMEEHPIY